MSTQHDAVDWDTISRAVPIEIAPEKTERYPVGLGDDLRGLSACRPRSTSPQ